MTSISFTCKSKINALSFIAMLAINASCFAATTANNDASNNGQTQITAKLESAENSKLDSDASTTAQAITAKDVADTAIVYGTTLSPYQQLANLAFKGKGTDGINSYSEAAANYCKRTRDNNDANAAFAMGWMYLNGRGVEKDLNIAALFFTKAIVLGNARAKIWLENSHGNPSLAGTPSCLIPEPLPPKMVQTTIPEAEIKPFYVKGPIYKLVSKLAPKYEIEPDLAMAFIAVESNYDTKATSAKNAQGLMQLIPETASRFNVKNAYDPEQNIKGGLAYLQWLLAYFEGDVQLVAAAYNSGENTVNKYNGIPPYPETRKYVQKISSLYTRKHHPYRDDLDVGKSTALANMQNLR